MKHNKHHLFQHKNLQVIGSVGVFTFGTAALAISNEQRRTPHKMYVVTILLTHYLTINLQNNFFSYRLGIAIYSAIFLQLGLGVLAMWARSFLESSNRGISKAIKFIHFILGIMLMLTATVNVYLGIQAYGVSKVWEYLYLIWAGM
jgi:hypothetical protein